MTVKGRNDKQNTETTIKLKTTIKCKNDSNGQNKRQQNNKIIINRYVQTEQKQEHRKRQ